MRLAFIASTKYIKKYGSQGDFQLGLSHLISKTVVNEYEQALRDCKQDIILDCGTFENHKPEAIDSLIVKAIRIKATHFFAPDHLYDKEKTQRSVEIAAYILNKAKIKNLKLAAVVQASNAKDWLDQYRDFCQNPDIDLIGLSILSIPEAFKRKTKTEDITENRIFCLKELLKLDIKHKKNHLLGLGSSYRDVVFAKKNCPFVVSNDTSCCFQSGLFEKELTDNLEVPNGKVEEKVNFDLKEITKPQEKSIQYNINQVKKIICN